MQNSPQRKPLNVPARFVVSGALQVLLLYPPLAQDGYGFRVFLNEFLAVFAPTVAVLLLIPVIYRGSMSQKVLAAILSLFPTWVAVLSWWATIVDHVLN